MNEEPRHKLTVKVVDSLRTIQGYTMAEYREARDELIAELQQDLHAVQLAKGVGSAAPPAPLQGAMQATSPAPLAIVTAPTPSQAIENLQAGGLTGTVQKDPNAKEGVYNGTPWRENNFGVIYYKDLIDAPVCCSPMNYKHWKSKAGKWFTAFTCVNDGPWGNYKIENCGKPVFLNDRKEELPYDKAEL